MARSWYFSVVLSVTILGAAGFACGGVGDLVIAGSGGGTGAGSSTGTSSGSASGGTTVVPCDVAQALSVCISCHSNPPIGGALGSLASYADLTALAPADPTVQPAAGKSMVETAIARMQDTAHPMPPAGLPAATSAQIQTLQSWVAAGMPMGSCADAGPPDTTFTGPSVCASGVTSPFTGDGSSDMTPGEACISCHLQNDGPSLSIGGTVFPTGHVPDDCVATSAQSADLTQAKVVITDANNRVVTLSVDYVGNFYRRSSTTPALVFPIHAKVVYQGKERPMLSAQTSGDCNSCHTDSGAHNAPGRVALPQ